MQSTRKAKDQKLLAWQDTPKKPDLPENLSLKIPSFTTGTSTTVSSTTKPVGKNLLWTSAATAGTPAGSPASISPLDSPSLRGSGLRTPGRGRYSLGMNPFEKQPDISTKRHRLCLDHERVSLR
ncbi:hypothetical protein FA13DRAFT_889108 [Coprinellus micaceus]|uniref:Uncharacterized protein n=1 Tax=Coprinellus micaceus TaxID=71717 RepID=A0A4Y7TSG8_COPMI|nr:hypothetical protein FA13DRAFT_889108 [Coprinellus micaceus]